MADDDVWVKLSDLKGLAAGSATDSHAALQKLSGWETTTQVASSDTTGGPSAILGVARGMATFEAGASILHGMALPSSLPGSCPHCGKPISANG